MAAAFSIPKADLLPNLSATLSDADGPINLTGAIVKFQMRLPGSSTLKVDTSAAVVSAVAGTVSYTWATGDTDTPGLYLGWFLLTFSGKTMEAPNPPLVIEVMRGSG
jgi:hypothetical protein